MESYDTNDTHYQSVSYLGHCCNGVAIVHLARYTPLNSLVAVKKFDIDKSKEELLFIEVSYNY